MAAVPEQVSVDAAIASVLSELEKYFFIERRAKNDTEGFS